MEKLNGVERIMKALSLEEPDVVPHFDSVHPKVANAILPDDSKNDSYDLSIALVEYMDTDAIGNFDKTHSWHFEMVDAVKNIRRDQWGGLAQDTGQSIPIPIEPAIRSEKDLEGYVAPDPDEEWRYDYLKNLVKRYKGHRCVLAHATDVFDIAKESILGDEAYFEAMINNPDLVDRVNAIVLDYNLRYIKNCIEVGIDCFFISGDFAMTRGPFVSPKHTARFLTPPLKKQVDLCHSMDIPVFKHTDGNIWPIFDLIVETGIDAIHPIDPMAGMELGEVKEKYGDRICLCGNVNCGPTLSWGTVEEVRQEVKECIRKAGPGGGYICMSSNSIHSGVKPENYIAMVKAIREFGKYPIDLD
jgi:uroporphyrinogen decarboxylase